MLVQMRTLPWTFGERDPDFGRSNVMTVISGQRFTLSRDELLTLPEFVLLSLFPNGLLPDGHLNSFHEGDAFQVDVSLFGLSHVGIKLIRIIV